ncbi:MAG: S41 family peptidase [Candidatus Roizmanbacteria bacterium]|nr:MAG: S41 family peptidase [Candidatus Roizmanbacteria bacterium]
MISKHFTSILLFLSLGIFLFGSGYMLGEYKTKRGLQNRPSYNVFNTASDKSQQIKDVDFQLFWDTWDKIEKKYVDKKKIAPQKMYYGAIKGMVASVDDPYTFFLTPDENKQSKDDLGGKFEGIGAQLGLKSNKIVVIAPLKNSPAEKAGIKSGDFIIKVNNESVKGWSLIQAVSKIRGPKGTKVKIAFERNGKEFEVELTRDQIRVSSVDLSYESKRDCAANCQKIAYLKLNQFGENTNDEWDKTIAEIQNNWAKKEIKGMVLDLRNNPGGYLESAVYLASEFLPEGKLIVKQESTIEQTRNYNVMRSGKLQDIPLTILINKGSASASEILSGALRDYKRATLVGEKSFGKGSVQEALDLKDGAGLHVTVAKWILPMGDWINAKGIEPQIKVENQPKEGETMTKETDDQLEKAIEEVLK